MKRTVLIVLALALVLAIFTWGDSVVAQSGGYTLVRAVVQNNGVVSMNSQGYQLKATVGQPLVASSTDGTTQLRTGYWYWPGDSVSPGGGTDPGNGGTGSGSSKQFLPFVRR